MTTVQTIPLINLAYTFIPVIIVIGILIKWSLNASNAIYAIARMLAQLLIIGYFLVYIFESQNALIIVLILAIMVFASSWIALGSLKDKRRLLIKQAFCSILLGGGVTLLLVTQAVLILDPWYQPQFMVPLAGMIFASAMNSISLAVERLNAELGRNISYDEARNIAFHASLIPIINSLFAVGLVTLPGMMTGQILSGVSPLIAIRYQIVVMCMLFGASGITTACFLIWVKPLFEKNDTF
ncbi:MAG: ABC transporter permease [Proteobacteria bacterium]|nr:ABC transporter permease [Pseudomonadota bacterium]NOG60390.1 ABC transporter permease [Pseudomonadota bacterium]